MLVDRYTKTVLTLIAVTLAYLAVVQTIRPGSVSAQAEYSVPTYRDSKGEAVVPVVIVKQVQTGIPEFPTTGWEFVNH